MLTVEDPLPCIHPTPIPVPQTGSSRLARAQEGWKEVHLQCIPPTTLSRLARAQEGWKEVHLQCIPPTTLSRLARAQEGWKEVHPPGAAGICLTIAGMAGDAPALP